MASHRKIHSNHTPEDGTYYRGMHRKIVNAMTDSGMAHLSLRGNVLDEALPAGMRSKSKWKVTKNG